MAILKYLQLPFFYDENKLRLEIDALLKLDWVQHYQTKHYTGEWLALPLRSVNGNANDIIISPTDNAVYQDTIFLEKCTYIKSILQSFNCKIEAVRLLNLKAGSVIKPHKDTDLSFEKGEIRIHIPIITNENVLFYLDYELLKMKQGECWYVNVNLEHRIENKSTIDRIHLVIDAQVNDWVKKKFDITTAIQYKLIEDASKQYSKETTLQMIAQFRQMNTVTSNKLADDLEATLQC